jgi:CDP-paratose 2-epimerase
MSRGPILLTGSHGLIGSEVVAYFCERGRKVVGVENNARRHFFGPGGDTTAVGEWLKAAHAGRYEHEARSIVDREAMGDLFRRRRFSAIVHCASQPSHDWARNDPLLDFDTNAVGTLVLLENARLHCPEAPFVFMSTNKVYGDRPNTIALTESEKRYDFAEPTFASGIPETLSIDQSLHSPFGASKAAADLMAQEYGRYFRIPVGIFRGGCLTGPRHSSVALHGFLSYIVKCFVRKEPYTIIGYKGKQVRDQIHSRDVVQALRLFIENPRCGEVYNLGGEKANSASILEIVDILTAQYGLRTELRYTEEARVGDHICYYSDMSKFRRDYPTYAPEYSLPEIVREIVAWEREQAG